MTNTNPKPNQASVTKDQDLQDKPWRKYKMKFQPGQTKYVAEMTQEEIDAHNDPLLKQHDNALAENETGKSSEIFKKFYSAPENLNFLKDVRGIEYVKKHFDYSPAIRAYGEAWLTEDVFFGGKYEPWEN